MHKGVTRSLLVCAVCARQISESTSCVIQRGGAAEFDDSAGGSGGGRWGKAGLAQAGAGGDEGRRRMRCSAAGQRTRGARTPERVLLPCTARPPSPTCQLSFIPPCIEPFRLPQSSHLFCWIQTFQTPLALARTAAPWQVRPHAAVAAASAPDCQTLPACCACMGRPPRVRESGSSGSGCSP